MTKVVCVKVNELNKRGINDFKEWLNRPDTVYIGRRCMVKNTFDSDFRNPFAVRRFGLTKSLRMYKKHIDCLLESGELSLDALKGKELGCWCKLTTCHGNYLVELCNRDE